MMGDCRWVVCNSTLGHEFRANFRTLRGGRVRKSVPICKDHERLCDALKETDDLFISPEGWVYDTLAMEKR